MKKILNDNTVPSHNINYYRRIISTVKEKIRDLYKLKERVFKINRIKEILNEK